MAFRFSAIFMLSCSLSILADEINDLQITGTLFEDTESTIVFKNDDEERKIQLLAVQTVANMAQGIINIGHAPDDSTVVAREVSSILGCFASFIIQAMKNPERLKCLQDEEYCQSIFRCIQERYEIIKKCHDQERCS